MPIARVPACLVSEVSALPLFGVSALSISRVSALLVSGVSGLLDIKGLSAAELKKQHLDEWLHCCFCCRLNVLWYEDVLNNFYDD